MSEQRAKIEWPREIMASVVVFLVALPLCMGIAIASGTPPALGLLTGIVGGLVVGWIAGSPLQVSGPAAGLAVLVFEFVRTYGLKALGLAVLVAGLIQLIAGLLKLGRWFRAVSPSLVAGMLAGIGVLIFASQFHVMVDDKIPGKGLDNLATIPASLLKGVTGSTTHKEAALVGIVTVLGIVLWNKFRPAILKSVPGPLVGIILGAGLAQAMGFQIKFVSVPANLVKSLNIPPTSTLSLLADPKFLMEAFGMALIASAETLLCATAVDRIAPHSKTNYDRELAAQGIGNMICGALGALPMTGVIVRSSANVEAGAKTRYSAIVHGFWLLLLVAGLPWILALIPTSALAGILVFTGYRLANPMQIKKWWALGKGETLVFLATVMTIVATNLLVGVLIGLACALIKLLNTFAKLQVTLERDGSRVEIALDGSATFMRLPILAEQLESLNPDDEVHVNIKGLTHVDHACMELLRETRKTLEEGGGKLVMNWDDLDLRHKQAVTPVTVLKPRNSSPDDGATAAA